MVYGIIKLINFAHGDIYMLGAFIGYYAISSLHMNFWIALIFTMIATACLGMIIEFLAYRPLRSFDAYCHLDYGRLVCRSSLNMVWFFLVGANTHSFPQAIDIVSYKIGSVTVTNIQLLIFNCFPCFDGSFAINR